MKKTSLTMAVLLLVIALPILVQAQQVFDFNGQAMVPTVIGGNLHMFAQIYDPFPALTPLPLDFDTYEYTLAISDLTLISDGFEQVYMGGNIYIYEDAATPGNYVNISSMTDGEIILGGVVTTLYRSMFTATLGSAAGTVNWNWGTRVDDIAPADQFNWPIVAGINASATYVEAGFDENWDGKVEPMDTIIPNTDSTWQGVKTLYR